MREDDAPSKRALLEAALRLFVRQGLCETTIRTVAEEAGFTNPAIFKFFKSRDALALCVFERCYERLSLVVEGAAAVPGFEPRVRAIIERTTEFMDAELDAFLFVNEELRRFWPETRPEIRRRSIVRLLGELFALGEASRSIAPGRDPALLTAAMIGTLTQFARALYFGELAGPAARRSPELASLILQMVR